MPLSLLWLFVCICHHQVFDKEITEKSQSKGADFLVSSSDRFGPTGYCGASCNSTSLEYPSFKGRWSYSSHFESHHGDLRALEMCVLQEDFQSLRKRLQRVSRTVARVRGHDFCARRAQRFSAMVSGSAKPQTWKARTVAAAKVSSLWRWSRSWTWPELWKREDQEGSTQGTSQGTFQGITYRSANGTGERQRKGHRQEFPAHGDDGAARAALDAYSASQPATSCPGFQCAFCAHGGRENSRSCCRPCKRLQPIRWTRRYMQLCRDHG